LGLVGTGKICLVSADEWYRIYGFDPKRRAPWKNDCSAFTGGSGQAEKGNRRAVGEKGGFEVIPCLLSDGTVKYIHTVRPSCFERSRGFGAVRGSSTDITDEKRQEMLLAGGERLLEMIARRDSRVAILDALCRLVEELASGSLSSVLCWTQSTNCLRHGSSAQLAIPYTEAIDGAAIGPSAVRAEAAAYRAGQ